MKGKTLVHSTSGTFLRTDEVEEVGVGSEGKETELRCRSDGGLVRLEWEKMSKSKENGVDPMSVVSEVGIDALRVLLFLRGNPKEPLYWDQSFLRAVEDWFRRLWRLARRLVDYRTADQSAMPPIKPGVEAELKRKYNIVHSEVSSFLILTMLLCGWKLTFGGEHASGTVHVRPSNRGPSSSHHDAHCMARLSLFSTHLTFLRVWRKWTIRTLRRAQNGSEASDRFWYKAWFSLFSCATRSHSSDLDLPSRSSHLR